MKSTNMVKKLPIEGGNTVRFESISQSGRIQLEGTGQITVAVSVDGVNYKEVEHEVVFEEGRCIAPFCFYIGDKVRVTATTLTKVIVNFNNVNINERG